jgi:uncharacterized protein
VSLGATDGRLERERSNDDREQVMSQHERWYPSHLREIGRTECLELIGTSRVGRVAYCDEHGPVVLPVNHVLDGDQILIRISPHSLLARHLRSGRASFQVDEFDDYTQSGWSVLVRADAEFVPYDELPEIDERPYPWAEGQRTLHVRLSPTEITGRRLFPA